MLRDDIKSLFDQAYRHMSLGEYALAARCFEEVIKNSDDPYASRIAEQRIRWYCIPLEVILSRMQACHSPVDVHDVLASLFTSDQFHIEAEHQPIIQVVESELAKLSSVTRIGNKVWVQLDIYQNQLEDLAQAIMQAPSPVAISNWLLNQFHDCEPPSDYPDEMTLDVFRSGVREYPIVVLSQEYAISKTALASRLDSLVASIRDIGQPIHINKLMEFLFPEVSPELVSRFAPSLVGQLDSRFVEVTADMIFLDELLKLTSDPFEDIFLFSKSPLRTDELVCFRLFPGQITHPLTQQFELIAENRLAHNHNLRKLRKSRWISKGLEQELCNRAENYLLKEGIPQSSQAVLEKVWSFNANDHEIRNLLVSILEDHFRISQNVIECGDKIWLHSTIMKPVIDKSYQRLVLSSKPLTTTELLGSNLELTKIPITRFLIQNYENCLRKDARFISDSNQNPCRWRALDHRKIDNLAAYQALKRAHTWLTQEEIESLLITQQRIPLPAIDLTSDDRFKPFPPDRWGLKEWVSINELAYNYLLTSRRALHEIVIIGLISRENHIKHENAIFTPAEDPRFSQDSINRWFCRHYLSAAELDLLHQELIKYGGSGRKINILIRQVLHKDAEATDAEIKLNADERFIYLDELWFARQVAFYALTAEDVEKIYNTLAGEINFRHALSLGELVKQAIGHDGRLTDADVWLSNDGRFLHVHDDFWTLSSAPSPDFGRTGAGSVAVVHTDRDQLLETKEAGEDQAKLTHRSPRSKNDEETPAPRKKEYRTLTHLDILHGNLRISGMLKHWIRSGAANVHMRDEEDYEFIAYIDETGSILNIREWLGKRRLTYGDKISIQPASQQDELLIRPYGVRDEGVYQEALAHQEIEKLIEEARKVNKGFHDLMIEVMEAFDYPLHREDIYQLVNYQRTASRATISEILSLPDCPFEELRYFIPVGAGFWKFDQKRKEAYDMKMQELLAENSALKEQLVSVHTQSANQKSSTERMRVLSEENALLQQIISETNIKVEKLQKDKKAAEQMIVELREELETQRGQLTVLQTNLAESQATNQQLQNQADQEKTKLQERISTLDSQLDSLHILVRENQERSSLETKDIQGRLETLVEELEQRLAAAHTELALSREIASRPAQLSLKQILQSFSRLIFRRKS